MSEHDERPGHDDLSKQAEQTTDKNLHVNPDEATGDIDPFDEDDTEQTAHGLKQKGDEETR